MNLSLRSTRATNDVPYYGRLFNFVQEIPPAVFKTGVSVIAMNLLYTFFQVQGVEYTFANSLAYSFSFSVVHIFVKCYSPTNDYRVNHFLWFILNLLYVFPSSTTRLWVPLLAPWVVTTMSLFVPLGYKHVDEWIEQEETATVVNNNNRNVLVRVGTEDYGNLLLRRQDAFQAMRARRRRDAKQRWYKKLLCPFRQRRPATTRPRTPRQQRNPTMEEVPLTNQSANPQYVLCCLACILALPLVAFLLYLEVAQYLVT